MFFQIINKVLQIQKQNMKSTLKSYKILRNKQDKKIKHEEKHQLKLFPLENNQTMLKILLCMRHDIFFLINLLSRREIIL